MAELGRDPWRSSSSAPVLWAGPPTAGCPGLCPFRLWLFPRMETPLSDPLGNCFLTTLTVIYSFIYLSIYFVHLNRISCSSISPHCPLSFHGAPPRRAWLHLQVFMYIGRVLPDPSLLRLKNKSRDIVWGFSYTPFSNFKNSECFPAISSTNRELWF